MCVLMCMCRRDLSVCLSLPWTVTHVLCLLPSHSDITVSRVSPSPLCHVPPLSVSSLFLSLILSIFLSLVSVVAPLFLSAPSQMLRLVSVRVSVTSLSPSFFPPPPPLLCPSVSQTVDWYGDTRLRVFLALPQMGPWQHVRDQNVLYLSCQAVPRDQNGCRPLGGGGVGMKRCFFFLPLFK